MNSRQDESILRGEVGIEGITGSCHPNMLFQSLELVRKELRANFQGGPPFRDEDFCFSSLNLIVPICKMG